MAIDWQRRDIPSPCYVLDEARLQQNLARFQYVQEASGARVILALKGFALWPAFPVIKPYLAGCTASSVWEAELAAHEFGGEVHAYAPAWKERDMARILELCQHVSFNSISQWQRFRHQVQAAGVSPGLRINPEQPEATTLLYDPSAPGSRLGVRACDLTAADLEGIEGLHVHNLCENDSQALARTLQAVTDKFGPWLAQMKWLNLGGGHLLTREGYDLEHLITLLRDLRQRYDLEVILEPGSAVAWETGVLVSEVVDIVHNEGAIALLDISATAHMPDVLEMPYRPQIYGAGAPNELPHTYKLGGNSCLAGDMIDRYSFSQPLQPGDRLVFADMMHYTMVKTSFFNGVEHPGIGVIRSNGQFELWRQFSYDDFKARLG